MTRTAGESQVRFVYAIEALALGLIKIGVAADPLSRLAGLKTGSPDELILRGVILAAQPYDVEREIHRALRDTRVRGEWFSRSPAIDRLLLRLPTLDQLRSGIVALIPMHNGRHAQIAVQRDPTEDDQSFYRRALKARGDIKPWVTQAY